MSQESSDYCQVCQKQVLVRKASFNHLPHLIGAICTFGVWTIPWIIRANTTNKWRCSQCGTISGASKPTAISKQFEARKIFIYAPLVLLVLVIVRACDTPSTSQGTKTESQSQKEKESSALYKIIKGTK